MSRSGLPILKFILLNEGTNKGNKMLIFLIIDETSKHVANLCSYSIESLKESVI